MNELILDKMGLSSQEISLHRQRIKKALYERETQKIPIIDGCRIDNGGIIKWEIVRKLKRIDKFLDGYIDFIPAAGAASRYFREFDVFLKSLHQGNWEGIALAVEKFKTQGFENFCLPQIFYQVLAMKPEDLVQRVQDKQFVDEIIHAFSLPKALQPCNSENLSFLGMKIQEHIAIGGMQGLVVAIRPEYHQAVSAEINGIDRIETYIVHQCVKLSTLRFSEDGKPVTKNNGEYSMVSGGHGMLLRLFPQIKKRFPKAKSLFLRNVDNVVGVSGAAIKASQDFLNGHDYILQNIILIREFLKKDQVDKADSVAKKMILDLEIIGIHNPFAVDYPSSQNLVQLCLGLFHISLQTMEQELRPAMLCSSWLLSFFLRPVALLGQIAKNKGEFGGAPVFARIGNKKVKLCIEGPHLADEDRDKLSKTPDKFTHFNPAFVAFEIPDQNQVEMIESLSLWIMARKIYQGRPVYYHETVLFESIGNSECMNAVFVDIPKFLFNPHKSFRDGKSSQT